RFFSFDPRLLFASECLPAFSRIVRHATYDRSLDSLRSERVVVFPHPHLATSSSHFHNALSRTVGLNLLKVFVEVVSILRQQTVANVHAQQRFLRVAENSGGPGIN